MLDTPPSEPTFRSAALRRIVWWLWAFMAGLPYGAGLARLLYESDPARLALFGDPVVVVPAGLAAAAVFGIAAHRLRLSLPDFIRVGMPALLPWLYVLAPKQQVDLLYGVLLLTSGLLLTGVLFGDGQGEPTHRRTGIGAATIGAIAMAGYLLTIQPTVGRADTFEFQVTAPVLGVAHPTGYPLYLLYGKLLSLIPFGPVALRVNLTSVIAATTAVSLLFLLLTRVLRVAALPAGLVSVAFAFSPTLWSQAVIAEVYAFNLAFIMAILLCSLALVCLQRKGDHDARRLVIGGALLVGLSLTNHLTTVLILPAVGLALLFSRPQLRLRQWALAIGLGVLALLIYLYIPLRWPALHSGTPMPFADFIGWITGSRFSGALQLRAWLDDPQRWAILARQILDQFGWGGIALGVAGLALLARNNWQAAVVTLTAFAAYSFYGLNYLVPDISVFLIPLHLLLALWIGYGAGQITSGLKCALPATVSGAATAMLFTVLALVGIWQVVRSAPEFDWSDEKALEAWGREALALPLAEGSAILADSEKVAPLEYLHRIEGLRPDIDIVVMGTEQQYMDDLYYRLALGETVYAARFLPGLEGQYHLRSVGPLIEVGTAPQTDLPDDMITVGAVWENGPTLLGYTGKNTGEAIPLTLYWQAARPVTAVYHTIIRLVDATGTIRWESSPAFPVSNRYPQNAWKGDEVVPDFYSIPLAAALPPGVYTVEVALREPFATENLPMAAGDGWVVIGDIDVAAQSRTLPPLRHRMAVAFDGGALTGFSAPDLAAPGSPVQATAGWRYRDQAGHISISTSAAATGASLTLPGGAVFNLSVRPGSDGAMLEWVLAGGLIRCGWLQPRSESCIIGHTRLEGQAATEAIATFENRLALREIEFQAGERRPGEVVAVGLRWQGLATMTEDYTIFVHLLGPDGRLYGQVDQWPVQGTFPTSQWRPGEAIQDNYTVQLAPDAPAGLYQVEIGVYLLGTNTRLLIVDAEGRPVGDHVLVPGLSVTP
ncbi:MAG: DUF2723 domain-containing protein [Anaerolineae bacterium]|nr:DUF2723 domain-containing protein [Anaerolineae bacterium]